MSPEPRSGLAAQYGQLELQLAKRNSEDAFGALAFAREAARGASQRGTSLSSGPRPEAEHMLSRLREIQKHHESDPEIQHALSRAFYQKQSLFDAAIASDLALVSGVSTEHNGQLSPGFAATVNRLRLRIFSAMDDVVELTDSALSILRDSNATEEAVLDAILQLATGAPEHLPNPEDVPALVAADPERLMAVALRLAASPPAAVTAASIAALSLTATFPSVPLDEGERNNLQLLLIAGGRFEVALQTFSQENQGLSDRFNKLVADWGSHREPDIAGFAAIVDEIDGMESTSQDANLYQCTALAAAVYGDRPKVMEAVAAASRIIARKARREFSCWTYFNVQPREFEQHLAEIVAFEAGGPPPDVLTRAWGRSWEQSKLL